MHILLLFVLLQAKQAGKPPDVTTPQMTTVKPPQSKTAPNLAKPLENTVPELTADTVLHLQMEREIGGQAEAVGELKARVKGLEDNRENHDRPDIDDLKNSRLHFKWTLSIGSTIIGTIIVLVLPFRKFLWSASLPFIRREIVGNASSPANRKNTSPQV